MKSHVKRFWDAAPLASLLLAAALLATLVFATRTALFWTHHHDPLGGDPPVAAWMTPGYIAHSWHVPPKVVFDALDAPRALSGRRKTLAALADETGVPVAQLIARTEAAIEVWRAAREPDRHDAALPERGPGAAPGPGDERSEEPAPPPDGAATPSDGAATPPKAAPVPTTQGKGR